MVINEDRPKDAKLFISNLIRICSWVFFSFPQELRDSYTFFLFLKAIEVFLGRLIKEYGQKVLKTDVTSFSNIFVFVFGPFSYKNLQCPLCTSVKFHSAYELLKLD